MPLVGLISRLVCWRKEFQYQELQRAVFFSGYLFRISLLELLVEGLVADKVPQDRPQLQYPWLTMWGLIFPKENSLINWLKESMRLLILYNSLLTLLISFAFAFLFDNEHH